MGVGPHRKYNYDRPCTSCGVPPPGVKHQRTAAPERPRRVEDLGGTMAPGARGIAFVRAAGTVYTPRSRSISVHSARRTSPRRAAFSTRNSNASRTAGLVVDARTIGAARPRRRRVTPSQAISAVRQPSADAEDSGSSTSRMRSIAADFHWPSRPPSRPSAGGGARTGPCADRPPRLCSGPHAPAPLR